MSRTTKQPFFCPRGKRHCRLCTMGWLTRFKRLRATGERRR
jgi:hypothetical protein